MKGSLLVIGAVLAALLLPGSMLCSKAWSAETETVAELQAKVDALSRQVEKLNDSVESLRREVESTKLTLNAALGIVQLMKDNLGKSTESAGSLAPSVQMLSLQVEKNRDNIVRLRDCVLGNWNMVYWAFQRGKGNVAADGEFSKYDKQTEPKFKLLKDKFQDRPAGPLLPPGVE